MEASATRLELQQSMDREAMAVREEAGLQRVVDHVRELRQRVPQSLVVRRGPASMRLLELRGALELENLLLTAEAVTSAALRRRESRGFHFRIDYPEKDDAGWRRNLYLELRGDELAIQAGPLADRVDPLEDRGSRSGP